MQEGGGRKGLPRSFLNRFTRVHVELLTREDMLFITGKAGGAAEQGWSWALGSRMPWGPMSRGGWKGDPYPLGLRYPISRIHPSLPAIGK